MNLEKSDLEQFDTLYVKFCENELAYKNSDHFRSIVPLYWFLGLVMVDGPQGIMKFTENIEDRNNLCFNCKLLRLDREWGIRIFGWKRIILNKSSYSKTAEMVICDETIIMEKLIKYAKCNSLIN